MTIYILEGSTGEYSDQRQWIVCAYRNFVKATEHAKKAQERADELFATAKEKGRYYAVEMKNEFDKNFDLDYTGTWYNVYEVELVED